jgi:LysR family transcriptional regulator, regulator of the ytmI operon
MDLRHLQTFQSVVEHGSFLRAAEALQYAQSTITLHIQQLEADLGVQLFARQGKKVQLTEAGRLVRDEAGQILARVEGLRRTMRELVDGEAGRVRLGSIEPTASRRLPPLLVPFYAARPQVRLALEVGGTQAICQRIAAGDLDLGIVSPPPASLGLLFEPLFVERMALLAPEGHPLAAAESIAVRDLRGQRLLLTEQGCVYREVTERALGEQGAAPFPSIEIGSVRALTWAVQRGLGVAIVPAVEASPLPPGTRLRELPGLDLGLVVGLVRRAGDTLSPATEALLALLRERLNGSIEPE